MLITCSAQLHSTHVLFNPKEYKIKMVYQLPVIDFSDFSNRSSTIAQEVLYACKTIGFFYVINHEIPKEMVDNAFALSKKFYDLPLEKKDKFYIKNNRGYTGLFVQKLDPDTQKQGDHKEAFNFGPFVNGEYNYPLPEVFEESKSEIESFSRACHGTITHILEAFAIALQIPEEEGGREYFSRTHQYDEPKCGETLRFLKYPRGAESTYKEPVRAGAHTDYGSITLLFQKDIGGLEVQASRTEWISAPIIDDAILVNVGGVMEYWTNGLFKSTMHRVCFMPEHQTNDRYSIACFGQPKRDVQLKVIPSNIVPKERPTFKEIPAHLNDKLLTSAEYLQLRLDAAYENSKQDLK
ncbi:hypothetical protein BDB00DRAFT_803633 [Zychaea mexicana]|uniref:uncharacterized protein n=1 Tax=Zychaea mexicana TaxID=64656 RepID=UPI0022FE2648|nr:uncharacterized protein BDB00DRAFT_803633 [Zychaea mexicana]KAI9497690.1 hypothetical protein BDB00DRAFT_803633 [Zychaea mexicana]